MSEHHRKHKWSGRTVTNARKQIKAQLPLPCVDCGRAVTPDQQWDVGHIIPLAHGGNPNQYGASHRTCNRSAGGTLGATKKNNHTKGFRQW